MSLADKLFGTHSERQIKKMKSTVDKIEALAEKYSVMSDGELRGTTALLKDRLSAGETLDDVLPDAFAACREAATRVLGKRPFRVQLMGGIILHQGRIAEMKTGEGKTLVATMPAYLNALSGKGQKERQANLSGTIVLKEGMNGSLKDKVVMIIDDVFTTGSTLSECAKVIKCNKKNKPTKILCYTFAKTVYYSTNNGQNQQNIL